MEWPTDIEIEVAGRTMLGMWQRFLPSPATEPERVLLDKIMDRFSSKGGWKPELSKRIGWVAPLVDNGPLYTGKYDAAQG